MKCLSHRRANSNTLNVDTVTWITSGEGEDLLATYTLPGGTLANTGDRIRISASGDFANNAYGKVLAMYWGNSVIVTEVEQDGVQEDWTIQAEIMKTGFNTQSIWTLYNEEGRMDLSRSLTSSITDTSDIVIKVTGKTGTGATSADVRQWTFCIDYLPAPL